MTENFRYFFIHFNFGGGAVGSTILRQKIDPTHEVDHGLNVASAAEFLLGTGMPCILQSWAEVTQLRYEQWCQFNEKLKGQQKPSLSVLDGGKSGVNASAGPQDAPPSLHVVRPPDAPKPGPA